MKGKPKPWLVGRKHTEEARIKMCIARKKREEKKTRIPFEA